MSNKNLVSILVSSITTAIKATAKESAMLKFLARITFRAPHTGTLQETIEWNALVSSAILGQHEPFSDKEELDWQLMVNSARFSQVGIPSTLSRAYAEMGMGLETETDEWDYSDPGFSDECPFETCTVCNNDKFVSAKVESPFICGGCQDETRYHLALMKTEKEWEEKQKEEFLPF